jgi:CheY-like chemotaxis protein
MPAPRKRVLCIDDDHLIRDLCARVLAQQGYEVETAADGVDGLTVALARRFDLIICDVMMPYLDGYAVCDELRKHEQTRDVPLVLATARASALSQRTATLHKARYLQKPFRMADLETVVHALIGPA